MDEIEDSEGPVNSELLSEHYRAMYLDSIFSETPWFTMLETYRVPDTRPWWKKMIHEVVWQVWGKWIRRYKNWLHRDCGY